MQREKLKPIQIKFSDELLERLDKVQKREGISTRSDLIRRLLEASLKIAENRTTLEQDLQRHLEKESA